MPNWPPWPTKRQRGRSIVLLAKEKYGLRGDTASGQLSNMTYIPFTAQTRMSGVDIEGFPFAKEPPMQSLPMQKAWESRYLPN